ncbi:hypothetical protein GCM10009530_55500 [Microbispora corallina]|uniref:Zinc transporter ZupT n=1 Tax=Microbispora corallina TaxID=83302 RepID=A0ABQ4G751_9ACTN|nr:hypothetical protein [Microbispora corallina]GIH42847.1 hypothetical protein Mco01_58470 [Microbispora corallina]
MVSLTACAGLLAPVPEGRTGELRGLAGGPLPGPVLDGLPGRQGAWAAVLLICCATLAGAWLARRYSARVTVWLAVASAMMLVTALVDLLPDALDDAAEAGVPTWALGVAACTGFLVVAYFTRKGCACPDEHERPRGPQHAPGRHRRLRRAVDAALFGGMGTAAALTLHRAVEGATLALTASVVVVLALAVHSASEGLALAALLDLADQRLAPWLAASCAGPVIGVLTATFRPLPAQVVPILLSVVMGVLLRTAIVGIRLAAGGQRSGRLSRRQIVLAVTAAAGAGLLIASAHRLEQGHEGTPTAESRAFGSPYQPEQTGVSLTGADETTEGSPARALIGRADEQAAPASPRLGGAVAHTDRPASLMAERSILAELLARSDASVRRTPVGRALHALPGYGRGRVATLLSEAGIGAERPLGTLTGDERRRLLHVLGSGVQ